MYKRSFLGLTALAIGMARVASAAVYPTEFWVNNDQGWVVETRQCGETLCGYLVSYKPPRPDDPTYVPVDVHNPDPKRRAVPLCGLRLMGDFKPGKDASSWEDGWIYDPDTGSTYSGTISLSDPAIVKLRGYIGISLFGKTLTLKRTADAPARCSAPPAG